MACSVLSFDLFYAATTPHHTNTHWSVSLCEDGLSLRHWRGRGVERQASFSPLRSNGDLPDLNWEWL